MKREKLSVSDSEVSSRGKEAGLTAGMEAPGRKAAPGRWTWGKIKTIDTHWESSDHGFELQQ